MHRRTSSKNRLLKKILEFSLSFVKAVVRTSRSFIRFATKQLLFELFLATVVIGLSYLFTIWGISQNIALWLAVAVVLGLLLVAIYIFSKLERNKRPNENKFRGEIGLAWWISQTFAEKKSTEWNEYQDWLHDILLSRRQLLDAKYPQWKVQLITYWRLWMFCIMMGIGRVKQMTVRIWRSR